SSTSSPLPDVFLRSQRSIRLMMALRVQTQISGDVFILRCEGRIVFGDECAVLRERTVNTLPGTPKVVVNLNDVDYIDSGGLGMDATNCSAEELIDRLPEVQRIVTVQPRNSVLTLGDLTGAKFSRDAVTRMKEVAVFDRPYVKRAALVGAQSLPTVFYEALKTFSQREFRRFKTREEAMGWLV